MQAGWTVSEVRILVIRRLGLLILPVGGRLVSCNCILCDAIETAFYGRINLLRSYNSLVIQQASTLYGSAHIF